MVLAVATSGEPPGSIGGAMTPVDRLGSMPGDQPASARPRKLPGVSYTPTGHDGAMIRSPDIPHIAVIGPGNKVSSDLLVQAREVRVLAARGAIVLTGGLGGVMEAASRGVALTSFGRVCVPTGCGVATGTMPWPAVRRPAAWADVLPSARCSTRWVCRCRQRTFRIDWTGAAASTTSRSRDRGECCRPIG